MYLLGSHVSYLLTSDVMDDAIYRIDENPTMEYKARLKSVTHRDVRQCLVQAGMST